MDPNINVRKVKKKKQHEKTIQEEESYTRNGKGDRKYLICGKNDCLQNSAKEGNPKNPSSQRGEIDYKVIQYQVSKSRRIK